MSEKPRKPKAPAGWYPHPSMADTRRYWDGAQWSDDIAPAETAPDASTTQIGMPVPVRSFPAPRPVGYWSRWRRRFWICAAVSAAMSVVAVFGSALDRPGFGLTVADAIFAATVGGAFYGTIVTTVAACFPAKAGGSAMSEPPAEEDPDVPPGWSPDQTLPLTRRHWDGTVRTDHIAEAREQHGPQPTHPSTIKWATSSIVVVTIVAVLVATAVTWSVVRDPEEPAPGESSYPAPTVSASPSPLTGIAASDLAALEGLRKYTRRWNQLVTPVVRDYNDPNVSADQWLRGKGDLLMKLGQLVSGLRADSMLLQNDELRALVRRVGSNYQDKWDALNVLVQAVAGGRSAAERRAQIDLRRAAQAGNELAFELSDLLRRSAASQ
jgi:hypothetical protein